MEYRIYSLIVLAFIVKWVAVETYSTGCPQPEPYTDEYGITHRQTKSTLQACYSSNKKPMERRFESEEEADKFINSMPRNDSHMLSFITGAGYVENVEKFKSEN